MSQRDDFVAWCLEQERLDAIYIWNADGEYVFLPDGSHVPAYDCSGFVVSGYMAVGLPDWRRTHWSQRLFDVLPETFNPRPGDLAFYGHTGKHGPVITHVVVCLGGVDGEIIGANGGTSDTKNAERALAVGARVKRKPTPAYRKDLRGFRKSPFTDEPKE